MGRLAGCRLETMSSLTLLASANSQSYLPPMQLVSSTTAVLALSTFRATRCLLVAGRPPGVLLRDQAFDPLGQLARPILSQVRAGPSQVQVALVLERLGGGAVGDPLLLELVQVLGALQHDDHRGQAAGEPHGVPTPATTGSAAATASSSSLSHW